MAKRKRYRKSSCPEPINTLLDIAGAVTLGAYVKHKVKKDYQAGCGKESAQAASAVFGVGSMRRGSQGIINLGGLMGLNSALKDIENQTCPERPLDHTSFISPIEKQSAIKHPVKSGIWRARCEDGSLYGISPDDYNNADDYEDALQKAKQIEPIQADNCQKDISSSGAITIRHGNQYRWRLHCENGAQYGVSLEDYETADDYEEALEKAKTSGNVMTHIYCRVSIISTEEIIYCTSENEDLKIGNVVSVERTIGTIEKGIILSKEYTPVQPNVTGRIIE